MSDDTRSCPGCASQTETFTCAECNAVICSECADIGLCVDCVPDEDDEFVTCTCGEEGYAGRDGMFTFNCKKCEKQICESCSANNLCEECEWKTTGVITVHFR